MPGRGRKPDRTTSQRRHKYAENRQVPVWRLQCHCLCCAYGGQRVPLSRLPASVRRAMDQQRVFSEGNRPPEWSYKIYTRTSNAGTRINHHFCPTCGVTVCWTRETGSTRFGIPVGAFNEPSFPAPSVSLWEERRYEWSPPMENVDHWGTQPPPP